VGGVPAGLPGKNFSFYRQGLCTTTKFENWTNWQIGAFSKWPKTSSLEASKRLV
jgi:hypothetical protein